MQRFSHGWAVEAPASIMSRGIGAPLRFVHTNFHSSAALHSHVLFSALVVKGYGERERQTEGEGEEEREGQTAPLNMTNSVCSTLAMK